MYKIVEILHKIWYNKSMQSVVKLSLSLIKFCLLTTLIKFNVTSLGK